MFGNSKWVARVIENENTILVLNILDATGLVPPFGNITVEHDGVVIRNMNTQKVGSKVVKNLSQMTITFLMSLFSPFLMPKYIRKLMCKQLG